jgi:hypothetical protein
MEFRHEVKFLINRSNMITIRQRLRAAAYPDPHTIGGRYKIRSLYFDNLQDKALMEKLNGVNNREKFRIRYHELFREFLDTFDFASIIDETAAMIAENVEKDPTKFCTYEEFEAGAEALRGFCTLREESVYGQLDGTILATSSGQNADGSSLIDTSSLDLSAMGTMGGSKGAGGFGGSGERDGGFPGSGEKTDGEREENGSTDSGSVKSPYGIRTVNAVTTSGAQSAGSVDTLFGGTMPQGGNGTPPSGFGGSMPEGFDGTMPEGFDGNLPEGFDGTVPDNFDPSSNPFASGRSGSAGEEGGADSEASGESGSGSGRSSGSRPSSFPGGGSSGEGFSFSGSGFGSGSGSGGGNTNTVILLAVSAVVLLAGLLVAWKYWR